MIAIGQPSLKIKYSDIEIVLRDWLRARVTGLEFRRDVIISNGDERGSFRFRIQCKRDPPLGSGEDFHTMGSSYYDIRCNERSGTKGRVPIVCFGVRNECDRGLSNGII